MKDFFTGAFVAGVPLSMLMMILMTTVSGEPLAFPHFLGEWTIFAGIGALIFK